LLVILWAKLTNEKCSQGPNCRLLKNRLDNQND
jgi:hypothetical protein